MSNESMSRTSLGRGFSWNLAGSTVYNLGQWLLVVLLAQLSAPEVVGRFSLMLAISAPVYLCLGLNLRVVAATDITSRWNISTYLRTRQVTSVIALVATLAIGWVFGLRGWDYVGLAMLCAAKSTEALGQTIYGYFQRARRIDLVGMSMILRAVSGAGSFAVLVMTTGELFLGCFGLWLGWTAVYLAWDRRHLRELGELWAPNSARLPTARHGQPGNASDSGLALVRKAAPLGVDAGLSSLTINAPRYALQASLGAAGLAKFAALAYTTQTIGMVTASLADGIVSQLAHAHAHAQRRQFIRLLGALIAFSTGVTLVALAAAWLFGDWAILHLLGREYVNTPLLLLLVVSAGITTLQRSLARGLQASHSFHHIAWVDAACLGATVVACAFLVPSYGLEGAALALCVGMAIATAITTLLVLRVVRSIPSASASDHPAARPVSRENQA